MSLKSLFQKNAVKNLLISIIIIAFISISSLIGAQIIVANKLSTVSKVPDTHNVSELSVLANRPLPPGYQKPVYKAINSPYVKPNTPHPKDLSLEEAAEIAAQEIFRFFGGNLQGKTFKMSYSHPRDGIKRSLWTAEVSLTPTYHCCVIIDACTGELIEITRIGDPALDEDFDIDSPSTRKLSDERLTNSTNQIKSNLDASCEKVQTLITQNGYISEPIKSIYYTYTYCDAYAIVHHCFDVLTDSGKVYLFHYSQDLTELQSYGVDICNNDKLPIY